MSWEEIRNYCLNCINKPCSNKGCPLNNDIPAFIHEENTKKAFEILSNTTVLPAICGAICPHEKQCQGSCIRGINGESVSIGKMEEYIGKESIKNNYKIPTEIDENLVHKKVAVVGSGPAGLTCSAFLAKKGVQVTIYEKFEELGGILTHGIPNFRLDKNIVKSTIDKILDLGIKVKNNIELGKDFTVEELCNEYDAVFIGIGANVPTKMNIEGEDLEGVYGGNTLLENGNHPNYEGKKVAIIGGGNVAMDAARTVKRLGAEEVYVIYRRAEEQMPAERKEIEDAKREGIKFLFQNNIVRIMLDDNNEQNKNTQEENKQNDKYESFEKNNQSTNIEENKQIKKVCKIECIKTKLVQKENETRLSPVNIENSNYIMDMDYVIMATGSKPKENNISNFEKNKWGYINVNEKMQTSIPKVYAGGDIVGEKATVAYAARSGRNAAESIIKDFQQNFL